MPAIVAPSPYYTSAPGQFFGQSIADVDGDGLNDRWPLWYDNYFVPRGYAVILAEMDGTANSTGCAINGGPSDVLSHQGRRRLAQRPRARLQVGHRHGRPDPGDLALAASRR